MGSELRAVRDVEGALADVLRTYKYRPRAALELPLSVLALEVMADALPEVDVVTPVPLHPKRLRRRGFNQSGLLARRFARAIGVDMVPDLLVRERDTAPQVHQPTAAARRSNVSDAFRARRVDRIGGRRVLLVDDVLTTGATASACARALKDAGAIRTEVWTVARGG